MSQRPDARAGIPRKPLTKNGQPGKEKGKNGARDGEGKADALAHTWSTTPGRATHDGFFGSFGRFCRARTAGTEKRHHCGLVAAHAGRPNSVYHTTFVRCRVAPILQTCWSGGEGETQDAGKCCYWAKMRGQTNKKRGTRREELPKSPVNILWFKSSSFVDNSLEPEGQTRKWSVGSGV